MNRKEIIIPERKFEESRLIFFDKWKDPKKNIVTNEVIKWKIISCLGEKSSLKKFINTKINKAKAHDFKKSEYFTAKPIIKKGRGFKIEYNCEEIFRNKSWKTKMNIVE